MLGGPWLFLAKASSSFPDKGRYQPMFYEAIISVLAEDEMIQERDSQDIARFPQSLRYVDIFLRRLDIPRWVIVGNDNGAGPVRDWIGKNLSWMDDRLVYEAGGDLSGGDHFMGAVE